MATSGKLGSMKKSAGILLYRRRAGRLEVLLAHPGGPFWKKRDAGSWTIPKGEIDEGEEPFAAARRAFIEETGVDPGHRVEGDCDADCIRSNDFSMEWPPRSGKMASFPEIDRAGWFTLDEARGKILPGQAPFLDELQGLVPSA